MGPLQAVAEVVDLVWDDTDPVMTIDRPTPAGVWNELWWYRSPSSVNIMFWLGAGEHELGDHMELAELAGATDYLCDWESELTNHAENKTYHMHMMQWNATPYCPGTWPLGEGTVPLQATINQATGWHMSSTVHPVTGEPVTIQGQYPEAMRCAAWQKWSETTCTK